MAYEERETRNLIGSDKVEGTAVYGADDQRIGSIDRVMIDKISGRTAYAVLGFGGFLGIGDDHYPLPWQSLKYDTNLGGYVTGATEDQLRGVPKYSSESSWNWSDPAMARSVMTTMAASQLHELDARSGMSKTKRQQRSNSRTAAKSAWSGFAAV